MPLKLDLDKLFSDVTRLRTKSRAQKIVEFHRILTSVPETEDISRRSVEKWFDTGRSIPMSRLLEVSAIFRMRGEHFSLDHYIIYPAPTEEPAE